MTEKREVYVSQYLRVGYPVFEGDIAAYVSEMNAFYAALKEAVIRYADEVAGRKDDGVHLLHADYLIVQSEERISVHYKIQLRRRGKTVATKTFSHAWENGALVASQIRKRKKAAASPKALLTHREK